MKPRAGLEDHGRQEQVPAGIRRCRRQSPARRCEAVAKFLAKSSAVTLKAVKSRHKQVQQRLKRFGTGIGPFRDRWLWAHRSRDRLILAASGADRTAPNGNARRRRSAGTVVRLSPTPNDEVDGRIVGFPPHMSAALPAVIGRGIRHDRRHGGTGRRRVERITNRTAGSVVTKRGRCLCPSGPDRADASGLLPSSNCDWFEIEPTPVGTYFSCLACTSRWGQ